MRVSTKGRYALRLMVELAKHPQQHISLRSISEKQQISQKYLEQIIMILVRSGFVLSTRGPQGGYQLAMPPEEITAGMIIRSMEGSLAPVACLECGVSTCDRAADCKTLPMWGKLNNIINQYLDHITLDDLIHNTIEERLKNKDWLK